MGILSRLPFISYWGAREVKKVIGPRTAAGGYIGAISGFLMGHPVRAFSSIVTEHYGPVAGELAFLVGWLVVTWSGLVVLAYYAENSDDDSNSGQ